MKNSTINVIVASIAVIILGCVAVNGYKDRNQAQNSVSVTGMASKDFVSDLIVWSGRFSVKDYTLAGGYKKLEADAEKVRKYFAENGLSESDFVFSSVDFYKDYTTTYHQGGGSTTTFNGYVLTQSVEITSKEVDKIEGLSRNVTSLINQGVEFSSESPQYYYTKLSELKLEMIAQASENGLRRAQQIVENAGGKIKDLQSASLGVFQITAQNSNEEYSYGGAFNTYAKDKTATITVRLKYRVK